MKELQELLRQAEHYERTKPIFQEMNKIPWKDKREKFRRPTTATCGCSSPPGASSGKSWAISP